MVGFIIGIIASLIFIYPIFSGLILLPLDLLVCNSAPWLLASQILIKNSYMLDSVIQMYPWRHMTFASLTHGIIPLWNPYQFTGMPFMASMKPMVFYPFNLLFMFGEISAWNALLFFQLFLAFFFCYLLMRKLAVSVGGSLLASVAFAYSSLMVGFLEFGSDGHTLIWLPFLCYCAYEYLAKKQWVYLTGLSIGIAFAFFAGHLQMVAYEYGMVIAFVFFIGRSYRSSWKDVLMIFCAMIIGCGIAAVQLIPGIELFSLSGRGMGLTKTLFSEGLIRPQELLRIFSPDIFGHPASMDLHVGYIETGGYYGLVPLFFTLFAFSRIRNDPTIRFFGIIFVLSIVFSMWPFGLLLSYLHIPLVTSGSGGRLFFIALFSGAVLSGYGLDIFRKNQNNRRMLRWTAAYIIGILVLCAGAYVFNTYIVFFGATVRNLKFSVAVACTFFVILGLYMYKRKKYYLTGCIFVVAILALSYFDLFRMGYRFLTFSNSKFMYPDIPVVQFVREKTEGTLQRTYGLVGGEVPSVLHIFSIETYNPPYLSRTAELLKALEGKAQEDFPTNNYQFAFTKNLKYLFDVLGVSYVVTIDGNNPSIAYFGSLLFQNNFSPVYKDERHDVYINKDAHPRFGLFYQAQSGLSGKAILEDIRNKKTDLRTTVLLEESLEKELSTGTGSAELRSSDVNSQRFLVITDTPALFYISDAHTPGWTVTVNGKKEHLYRANYNFRAVLVPAGESEVVLRYTPLSYTIGIWISAVSLFFLGFLNIASFMLNNQLKANKRSY